MATCEWVIDILQEWANVRFSQPPIFVDRGDPAATDYTQATLTRDAAWHDLDLSAIVPGGASAVSLVLRFRSNLVGQVGWFRKNGNANNQAISSVETAVGGVEVWGDFTVALDSDRKIEYLFAGGGIDSIDLTVKGWWL